ncbi:MAG TPA: hypothetical protein VGQ64_03035 [Candidatus Limnocylindrales bacterium]|jgi:hypothetical protein|nr:hypothetical protein [Candidatus Limnocylindrales bacterium]
MDDQTRPTGETDPTANPTGAAPGGAGESPAWGTDEPEASASAQGGAGATAERMISQLQSMIDSIATQAAPVVRQVGAKAAELAAAAADRAGPIAHRAADATADASVKIAERSRVLAADLRRDVGGSNGSTGEAATTVLDGVDDAAEQAAKDDPAEGAR